MTRQREIGPSESRQSIDAEGGMTPLTQIGGPIDNLTSVSEPLLRPPGIWAQAIIVSMVALITVGLLWANSAKLEEVTRGEGKVVPASKIQRVQYLEGGIVRKIYVRDGQIVKKGQIVLRIDATGFGSTLEERQEQLAAMEATIRRLRAEAYDLPLNYSKIILKKRPELVRRETSLFRSRKLEIASAVSSLKQQMSQRRQLMAEMKQKIIHAQRAVALVREEINLTEPLVKRGLTSKVQLIQLKSRLNELEGSLSAARLELPRLKSSISEAQTKIQEKLSGYRAATLSKLSEIQARAAALKKAIRSDRDKLKRTIVRSPVTGIVKEIKVSTVGQVVKPGEDLMEIVPLNDTLLIEAKVRPADIAFLRPGLRAKVKITAYDFTLFGSLAGKIERISADTVTDDKGNAFYKILVRTDRSFLGKANEKLRIIPGMIAQIDVLTGKKTVMQYLLKPLKRVRQQALRER